MQLRRSGRSMAPAEPAALATSVADDSPPSTSSAPSKSKKRASLSASRHPSSPALPTKHAQAPAKGKRKPAAVTVAEAVTEPAVEAEDEDHAEPKAKRRKGASASGEFVRDNTTKMKCRVSFEMPNLFAVPPCNLFTQHCGADASGCTRQLEKQMHSQVRSHPNCQSSKGGLGGVD